MRIITISGLDGSGKSTQIEMLKNRLESQNKRVFYFHAVEFSLARKIADFRKKYCPLCWIAGSCKIASLPESPERDSGTLRASESSTRDSDEEHGKSVTHANRFQIWLRKIFLKIDIWRFGNLRKHLRKLGYNYILSDRYFYDSVVNIEFLSDQVTTLDSRLRGNDIKPDIAIYLQTNPENIMSRERKPDQGIEYLKKKKELYDAKIAEWNFRVIDGDKNKEEVFENIKQLIFTTI
jgi:thymidylate kinase